VMTALANYCTVIMGNIWSANSLLGIPVDNQIHKKGTQQAYLEAATSSATHIFKKFSTCKWVANTFRFDGIESHIAYYAALNTIEEQTFSPVFKTDKVVERVGSGDCFMAGLIYGIINELHPQKIINIAAAAAFGKLQEVGDATNNSIEVIEKIAERFS